MNRIRVYAGAAALFVVTTMPAAAAEIDTDGDGLDDSYELSLGTDPLNMDTDGDGYPDGTEVANGYSPFNSAPIKTTLLDAGGNDAALYLDSDSDGLTDADESTYGTDPYTSDTDRDGYLDGTEVLNGYDPLSSAPVYVPMTYSTELYTPPSYETPSFSTAERSVAPSYTIPQYNPEPEPITVNCDPNYSGCVPIASDVDCAGGSGNGPAYVSGPIYVTGVDIYDLDGNSDGVACE